MQSDGRSLRILFNDPQDTGWNDVAYSYFNNGISVVSERYRLSKYFREEEPTIELYDHATDPMETNNIAADTTWPNELEALWQKGNTGLYNRR